MKFVAMQEASAGNETVGDRWIRTATFTPDATLAEVYKWARSKTHGGKLMLAINENDDSDDNVVF